MASSIDLELLKKNNPGLMYTDEANKVIESILSILKLTVMPDGVGTFNFTKESSTLTLSFEPIVMYICVDDGEGGLVQKKAEVLARMLE
jgi:hypothetical protein